jgi:hypothetical protein
MAAEAPAARARKREETVIFRNLAFACGTKMIVLYFRGILLVSVDLERADALP